MMDEAAKVDLLLIKKYLQQADYATKESAYYGSNLNHPIRRAIFNALLQVNKTLREVETEG